MKIQSAAISMSSQHSYNERHVQEESLRIWIGNQRPNSGGQIALSGQLLEIETDVLEISDEAKARLLKERQMLKEQLVSQSNIQRSSGENIVYELSEEDKQKIRIMQSILQALTGKKIKFVAPEIIRLSSANTAANYNLPGLTTVTARQSVGWGLEYNYHEAHFEQEQTTFQSTGTIKTADGKEISFSLQINMRRTFASQRDISIIAGNAAAVDPLVINFDGTAPSLTNNKISFDLDNDGQTDQISFLCPGSGFLALDENGDGIINNGGELFGPQSGDGFADLARYDSDGNQWIDENDPIYERLRIWTKDDNGNDVLFALGEKGIGAIYLGNISTPFTLKDSANGLQGQVQRTGIFIKEDGSAGTVQHVDLVR
ncbi:hypothetical protein [Desulfoscipio gibsoniae]